MWIEMFILYNRATNKTETVYEIGDLNYYVDVLGYEVIHTETILI